MNILSRVNIMKRKFRKELEKLSVAQKSYPALRRTFHRNISLIIVCFFFSQINLVFINLISGVDEVIFRTIYLPFSFFDILCMLKLTQCLQAFFIRTMSTLTRLNIFFEDLQPKNVLIMYLFSMKHSCLFTTKSTPGVSNSS